MKTNTLLLLSVGIMVMLSCRKDPNSPGGGNNITIRPFTANEQYFAGPIRMVAVRSVDPNTGDTVRFSLGTGRWELLQGDTSVSAPVVFSGRKAKYYGDASSSAFQHGAWKYDSLSKKLELAYALGQPPYVIDVYARFNDSFYGYWSTNNVVYHKK